MASVNGSISAPSGPMSSVLTEYPKTVYRSPAISVEELEGVVRLTALSTLSGTVYYYWYIDGTFASKTTGNSFSVLLEPGEQAEVDCIDSNDPNMDVLKNSPQEHAARRTLFWTRPEDTDIDHYLVQQNKDLAGYETIGRVRHRDSQWSYTFITSRLDDLADYSWKVIAYDTAGNAGTSITVSEEVGGLYPAGLSTIVRRPDSVDYDISFNDGTAKVTFSEA